MPIPNQSLPMTFLQAIAREEGFYSPSTRPYRNNKPGDIEWGKFTQAHGATHGDPRFAVFPTADAGFAAMRALFQCGAYRGLTVAEALNRWAPPVENQTNAYIANICKWTGCTANMVIDHILDHIPATSLAVVSSAKEPAIPVASPSPPATPA